MPARPLFLLPFKTTWIEDAANGVWARIAAPSTAPNARGTPYTQSSWSAITYSIYDVTTPGSPSAISEGQTITVSSAFYDTLQAWNVDQIGYNFKFTFPAACFPASGEAPNTKSHRAEVKFLHTDGSVGFAIWEGPTIPVFSS